MSRTRLLGGPKDRCKECHQWVYRKAMVEGRCMKCFVESGMCPCCQAEVYEEKDRREEYRRRLEG